METGDKAFYNGHYYTDKAIGLSIVAAVYYFPVYWLEQLLNFKIPLVDLKYLLTFLSIGLSSALSGSLIYILCKQITGDKFRVYVATSAVLLGTMILPFSVTFYGHPLAGALLFGAFFFIFQLKVTPTFRRKAVFFLIGFLLGFALITEYTVAPIVLILTLYYLYIIIKYDVADRRLAVILPVLGASIPAAIVLAYNTAIFGNPLSIGYSYELKERFQIAQSQGLMGISWPKPRVLYYLTIHPAMGLFWQSPVLILAIIGLWFMWRAPDYRIEALAVLAAFFSILLINSGYYMWWGGWVFGPRHLIPMLPFLCLPLIFIPGRWFYSVVVLGLISILQMFIPLFGTISVPDDFYNQIANKGFFAFSSLYSYCLRQLLGGNLSTNIVNKLFALNTWLSLIPFLMFLLVVNLSFFIGRDYSKNLSLQSDEAPI
jgi:hypothetical protein